MRQLTPALDALDALIAVEMQRLRARYTLSMDEFRGLYVSDVMAEALLAQNGISVQGERPLGDPRLTAPFKALAREFDLCPLGCGVLLLALAPECLAKYGALFAYLNDDVHRRWPTLDLARRLLCHWDDGAGADRLRALLLPTLPSREGGLVASGLLVPAGPDDDSRPELLQGWRPAPALVHHVLAQPGFMVPGLQRVSAPPQTSWRKQKNRREFEPVLIVSAADLEDAIPAAVEWALRQDKGVLLLKAPSAGLCTRDDLRQAALSARLCNSLLALEAVGPTEEICRGLSPEQPLAILTDRSAPWQAALASRLVIHQRIDLPSPEIRAALWTSNLEARGLTADHADVKLAAGRFALSAGAIGRAADRLRLQDHAHVGTATIVSAAAAENAADLSGLAHPIETRARWEDLVLPSATAAQLKDFAAAIAARHQVFDAWGFGSVGRGGKGGLAALFSGGSGTGKTMSAAIIAAELCLDLWRIDLASTVSKYIGETEKNLDKLFSAAGTANAILFFDEADALFGKRSEVKDAHDRYANIESAYLLQRLEDHPGIVILASNLSRNLDTAFLRRLPFVIEFPMPDPAARAALWRKAIPTQAPLASSIDFPALGNQFELSGGDIRTAALEAAFLAASGSGKIDEDVLLTAIRRQLMKRGQIPPAVQGRRMNGHRTDAPERWGLRGATA